MLAQTKKQIDKKPLSRNAREKCDKLIERIELAEGQNKVYGLLWLLSSDISKFNEALNSLEEAVVQQIKTSLLNLGIDITQKPPLYS